MQPTEIRDEIPIDASADRVWQAIKDPHSHARWHPFTTAIHGSHDREAIRRCDVLVGKKSGRTQERCTTLEEGRLILWRIESDTTGFSRMVSDWHAGFILDPQGPAKTRVVAQSTFRPRNLFVRLMLPLIRKKFHQTQEKVLAGLKQFAEANG